MRIIRKALNQSGYQVQQELVQPTLEALIAELYSTSKNTLNDAKELYQLHIAEARAISVGVSYSASESSLTTTIWLPWSTPVVRWNWSCPVGWKINCELTTLLSAAKSVSQTALG
jgi:hypothetical protein